MHMQTHTYEFHKWIGIFFRLRRSLASPFSSSNHFSFGNLYAFDKIRRAFTFCLRYVCVCVTCSIQRECEIPRALTRDFAFKRAYAQASLRSFCFYFHCSCCCCFFHAVASVAAVWTLCALAFSVASCGAQVWHWKKHTHSLARISLGTARVCLYVCINRAKEINNNNDETCTDAHMCTLYRQTDTHTSKLIKLFDHIPYFSLLNRFCM